MNLGQTKEKLFQAMLKKLYKYTIKKIILMFLVSNGYVICDYMTADANEFNSWINSKSVDCSQLKTIIIRQDWATIIGLSTENANIRFSNRPCLPDELDKIIEEHSCDREILDMICNVINDNIIEDEELFKKNSENKTKGIANL